MLQSWYIGIERIYPKYKVSVCLSCLVRESLLHFKQKCPSHPLHFCLCRMTKWCCSVQHPFSRNRSKCVCHVKDLAIGCVSWRPHQMHRYTTDRRFVALLFSMSSSHHICSFVFVFQNVPPDLAICCFILEQSLSVRALQEMLSNSSLDEVGQNERCL